MQENKRHKSDVAPNICDDNVQRQLAFDANFAERDFRLFEITKDILSYIEQQGGFRLAGDIAGDVVLCTDTVTYGLKKVETSNSMCIVPPRRTCDAPHSISSIKKEYYELTRIPPRVAEVEKLLLPSAYRGRSNESSCRSSDLHTYSSLEEVIQASPAEIAAECARLECVELGGSGEVSYDVTAVGFVRLVDKDTLQQCIQTLIDIIILHDINTSSVSESRCLELAPEMDGLVLQRALHRLGNELQPGIWCLDKNSVARHTAHLLFQQRIHANKSAEWLVNDFLTSWAAHTPAIDTPDASLLHGIAIITESFDVKNKSILHYVYAPLEALPKNAEGRFRELFSKKSKYSADELSPYFADIVGGQGQAKSLAELLIAHTRHVDGFYFAK